MGSHRLSNHTGSITVRMAVFVTLVLVKYLGHSCMDFYEFWCPTIMVPTGTIVRTQTPQTSYLT